MVSCHYSREAGRPSQFSRPRERPGWHRPLGFFRPHRHKKLLQCSPHPVWPSSKYYRKYGHFCTSNQTHHSRTFSIHLWTSHAIQHKFLSTKQKQVPKHFEQHNSVQPATGQSTITGGYIPLSPANTKSYFHSSFIAISCLLFCATSTSRVSRASHTCDVSAWSPDSSFSDEYTIHAWSSFRSGRTATEPGTSASFLVTRPSLFSPYLATSNCEHAAIAAESGITTGILVELPSPAIGSSRCATWESAVSTLGVMLASVWNETIGTSWGNGCRRRNSFRLS